jgi:hypothetical protein
MGVFMPIAHIGMYKFVAHQLRKMWENVVQTKFQFQV